MTCFHENIPPWFAFCNKWRHQMKWCNCCCNLLQMIKLNFQKKTTFGNNYFHLTWNPTSTLVTSLLIAALWNTMQKYFSPSWRPAATPGYQTGHPSLYSLAVPQYYVPEDNKQNWWQRKMHNNSCLHLLNYCWKCKHSSRLASEGSSTPCQGPLKTLQGTVYSVF